MPDEMIATHRIKVERKLFYVDVMENMKGRFVRITEDVRGRRDRVVIPETGVAEIGRILSEVAAEYEFPDLEEPGDPATDESPPSPAEEVGRAT